jgi:hypothetical protein
MKTAVAIRIDRTKTPAEEPGTGRHRWHPDIPPSGVRGAGHVASRDQPRPGASGGQGRSEYEFAPFGCQHVACDPAGHVNVLAQSRQPFGSLEYITDGPIVGPSML